VRVGLEKQIVRRPAKPGPVIPRSRKATRNLLFQAKKEKQILRPEAGLRMTYAATPSLPSFRGAKGDEESAVPGQEGEADSSAKNQPQNDGRGGGAPQDDERGNTVAPVTPRSRKATRNLLFQAKNEKQILRPQTGLRMTRLKNADLQDDTRPHPTRHSEEPQGDEESALCEKWA
jgi:hypothetical protein